MVMWNGTELIMNFSAGPRDLPDRHNIRIAIWGMVQQWEQWLRATDNGYAMQLATFAAGSLQPVFNPYVVCSFHSLKLFMDISNTAQGCKANRWLCKWNNIH